MSNPFIDISESSRPSCNSVAPGTSSKRVRGPNHSRGFTRQKLSGCRYGRNDHLQGQGSKLPCRELPGLGKYDGGTEKAKDATERGWKNFRRSYLNERS